MTTLLEYYKFTKLQIIIICFLIGFFTGQLYGQLKQLEDLDTYIEKSMEAWRVPGIAIAIVKEDQVIYNKGFGLRDINKNEPVDAKTQFAIASNTKAFTAHALGLLVQEGKISWDDPVLKYLPQFQLYDPDVTRKITIRDLLCHRSGLGTWAGDWVWWGSIYTRENMLDRIRFIKPISDFRTTYHYNNLMFLVAGEIIPRVTGMSWDDFLMKRIFTPLEMSRTNTSILDLDMDENVALPHTIRNDRVRTVPYVDVSISGPAGAINSCTADLIHWLLLQLANGSFKGKQLIDPKIIVETRKPQIIVPLSENAKRINPHSHLSAYAMGWFIRDFRGRFLVSHTGGLDGMYSYLGFMPDENIGVVILTNLDNQSLMRALAYHVYDVLLNLNFLDWSHRYMISSEEDAKKEKAQSKKVKVEGTKPRHKISDYMGRYKSNLYGDIEIYSKNGELKMRLFPHPNVSGKIEHWQYDSFLIKWSDPGWGESILYFDLDDSGDITQFRMSVRPDWIDTLEYTFVKAN
jgi:CubicO group peptidase (beta-lactamase class C family)